MTGGYKSFLGFWLGGVAAPPATPVAPGGGYCSFSNIWMGGICAPSQTRQVMMQANHYYSPVGSGAANRGGYRSLLYFWLGGANH
jgi:hypothetical protein